MKSSSSSENKTYHDLELKNLELEISPYKLHSLSTAQFGLDGGAMFGTVPKVLWSRTNPSDEKNRILLDCRCLLLVSKDKKILIDTGLGADFTFKYGEKLGPKFANMYAIENEILSGVESALSKLNISTKEITDVILTHLHFDHAGGATKHKDGKLVPAFEKATYHIQKDNLEAALKPNLREKGSYYACNFIPLQEYGVLNVLDGPGELFENIRLTVSHGHTKGQQSVWVEDGKNSLLYCADLIPTATHVRLPWIMGYDLDPLNLINEKRLELETAAKKDSYLFFEHDPYCAIAKVKALPQSTDYRLKEIFNLS